jgi:predicted negative regulator of RcsB-dependent stress response
VAYDLEEQEKIASLKAWWERYGNVVTSVVLGLAIAVGGYNIYQWYRVKQIGAASAAYDELSKAIAAKDLARVKEFSGILIEKNGGTAYAQMGALLAAKANLDGGDTKTAKAQLRWTADHAIDPEYRALASLRLSGVLLDEGGYADAMKEVATTASADLSPPLQAAFADRRGDIFAAQNKTSDAEREYRGALAQLEAGNDTRGYVNVVRLKLDALAAAPTIPVASVTPASVTPAPAAPAPATTPAKP